MRTLPVESQHCPGLTKEQRQVLDAAAEQYGTDWHVRRGKHYKLYLGDRMVCVLSLGRTTNNLAPVRPETRLRLQIRRAMEGDRK